LYPHCNTFYSSIALRVRLELGLELELRLGFTFTEICYSTSMLTTKDIKLLTSVLATKEDVREIKTDVKDLRDTIEKLVTAMDKLAGAIDDLRLEYAAIKTQLDRHERWIQEIAKKTGVNLKI